MFTRRETSRIDRCARATFACVALATGSASIVSATDENGPPQSEAARPAVTETGDVPAAVRPRVLVLIDDRIVEGSISRSPSGYVVSLPQGTYTLPYGRVKLEATDMQDAYRKQRRLIPTPTPQAHVALAGWCLTNNMIDAAQAELREALQLAPSHPQVREMLRRLEELTHPDDPLHRRTETPTPRTEDGFAPQETRTLAGLSKDVAIEFVQKVQPILVNRCGNASCHGPTADNELRLHHVRVGRTAHRSHSERNLAAVLRYVDRDRPDASPLIERPQGNHGGESRPIFAGSVGATQERAIRDWLRLAAKRPETDDAPPERADAVATREAPPVAASPFDAPQSPPFVGPPVSRPVPTGLPWRDAPVPAPAMKTASPASRAPADDPLLRRTLLDECRDAFDPDEFNRATRRP